MTISLISSFYNDKKMLKIVLESVLNQTHNDIEHIVADGGSTDGSVEILKEYEKKYSECGKRLIWVSEKDKGISDAVNKAANMATGDYMLCSVDPYVDSNVIAKINSKLESTGADYCYGGMLYQKDGKIIRQWSGKPGNWRLGWMAATPTFCFKRSLWQQYGPFSLDIRGAADYEFQIKIFKDKKLKSVAITEPLVLYYAGGTSNGTIKNNFDSIKESQLALVRNNVPFAWFTTFCKIVIAAFAYLFASRKEIKINK